MHRLFLWVITICDVDIFYGYVLFLRIEARNLYDVMYLLKR